MAGTKYTMLMVLALVVLAAGPSAAQTPNSCPSGMGLAPSLIGVGPVCINAQNLVNICTNNQGNCCVVGPVNAGVLGNLVGNIGNCGGPQDGGRRLKQTPINDCPPGMSPIGGLIGVGPVCVNVQRAVNICTDNAANCCAVGPINLGSIMGNVGNCGARK